MSTAWFHRWVWAMVVLGVGWGAAGGVARAQRGNSLADQISSDSREIPRAGASVREWQWNSAPRFVKLGGPEPGVLEQSIRVGLSSQEASTVQVSFHAKAPEGGFREGAFTGRKEVRFTIARVLSRLERRRGKIRAWGEGPFKLVAAEPEGHTLAEFSTLGGIARGRNLVLAVDEVFKGDCTFVLKGKELTFVNERFTGDTRNFPAQIVLEPVE